MKAGKIRSRLNPRMHYRNVDVSDAAQNHIAERKVIPAPEAITLQTMPKTSKTQLSLRPNRTNGKRGKFTLTSKLGMRIRKIVTIYRYQRMMTKAGNI